MPNPDDYPLFRLFMPTEAKVLEFAKRLMGDYLYADDSVRNYPDIHRILHYYLTATHRNVLYEIGDFGGLIGFTDVTPGWKAHMPFKIWEPKLWGATLARSARAFIGEVMDELHLIRLDTASPDPRMVKMARIGGFEIEAEKKNGFMWNGDLFTLTELVRFREEK